ncbi:hypothetical protein [Ectothiorhodospira variabilis]|uniref:hypothetical protein n=1 Tax=Ectothiorhodospira variabilis TaxID=505694 RepID=UPI001EFB753B|nr:hypothetical protein [Ectothiorhodospira variabilis]MCG5495864.1 hypothetical protein [Ectothiorhodospira variabilis]MCG5505265.1 hypothetical protein [Ectothiorhodospira variabilis]MCG5508422.1 hypothetical protein [Ectothiorhodospira variabilis]
MKILVQLIDRINASNLRERLLMAVLLGVILLLAWDWLVLQPQQDKRQTLRTELTQTQARLGELTQHMDQWRTDTEDSVHTVSLEVQRDALRQDVAQLEARLQTLHGGFASPREAVQVLAGILQDRPGVKVVELANQPPEPLNQGLDIWNGPSGIFVHRVRLVVEAEFDRVLDFMGLVEDLPEGVFWETLHLEVPEWPVNRVEMTLYGLSADESWLGL